MFLRVLLISATFVCIGCAAVVESIEKRETEETTTEYTASPYIEAIIPPYIEILQGRDG